jgi:hypothetical protein
MPGARLPMRKIRDVLRLSAAGMSKREIAASLSTGATAAGECLRRARRAGLSWPLPDNLSDEVLERLLYPPTDTSAGDRRVQPDWPTIHRELRRHGVTLQLLWEEHRAIHADGYGYSRIDTEPTPDGVEAMQRLLDGVPERWRDAEMAWWPASANEMWAAP